MLNQKAAMFVLATLMSSAPLARGQTTWSDDFEDGVIDPALWEWGGHDDRGIGGGSWQFSHEEIIEIDGHLKIRVWGPTSGGSHGAEAWVRTQYDYNDGLNYVINFRWSADVNASHVDMYAVQLTDGTIPGGTDTFWFGSAAGGTDATGWTNLYFQYEQSDLSPTDWSIHIDGANDAATLYGGPNLTGEVLGQKTPPAAQAWYVRFILADVTSGGFPAGDNLLSL